LIDVSNSNSREKAIIVGAILDHTTPFEVEEYLNELELLTDTAGGIVTDRVTQARHSIDSAYFIGKGKVEELVRLKEMRSADLIIFDDDLSPKQVRNLETELKCKIMDRTGLILDIFASNAKTSESKTQVELAQLEYILPRLTGMWTHLSKQKGGIGTKGPGETQIETDRRLIRERIGILKRKLEKIQVQKDTQRSGRTDVTQVALVGYTNAGKSTTMNSLSHSDVLVENRLFATLDSTTRTVFLAQNKKILLTDTVGFIRKLPHNLVASFRSTLDEVRNADILLHVVDITHPNFREHMITVSETLAEIDAENKKILVVFNKIDAMEDSSELSVIREEFPEAVFISANRGINTRELRSLLLEMIESEFIVLTAKIAAEHSKAISYIHSVSEILSRKYTDTDVELEFKINRRHLQSIERMLRSYQEQAILYG